MSKELEERPFKKYTMKEAKELLTDIKFNPGAYDKNFIAAVFSICDIKDGALIWLQTVNVPVVSTYIKETGIVHMPGNSPLLIINDNDIIDYDRIEQLHPITGADVYLMLDSPYHNDDADMLNEWWRMDVYPEDMDELKIKGVKND